MRSSADLGHFEDLGVDRHVCVGIWSMVRRRSHALELLARNKIPELADLLGGRDFDFVRSGRTPCWVFDIHPY